MLQPRSAIRVIVHLNEDAKSRSDYLHLDPTSFLFDNQVSGATVFRPHAGFGSHHRLHTQGAAGIDGQHFALCIGFVESKQKAESLPPQLLEMATDGMIETQEMMILKLSGQFSLQADADATGLRG